MPSCPTCRGTVCICPKTYSTTAHHVRTDSPAIITHLWNGPVCPVCRRGYIGTHECSVEDLRAIIADLERRIAAVAAGGQPKENPDAE